MMCVPIQTGPDEYTVVVIFFDENIRRMKDYDPGELVISKFGLPWAAMRLKTLHFHYATTEEGNKLSGLKDMTELKDFLNYLSRGWKAQGDDHDSDYQSPGRN